MKSVAVLDAIRPLRVGLGQARSVSLSKPRLVKTSSMISGVDLFWKIRQSARRVSRPEPRHHLRGVVAKIREVAACLSETADHTIDKPITASKCNGNGHRFADYIFQKLTACCESSSIQRRTEQRNALQSHAAAAKAGPGQAEYQWKSIAPSAPLSPRSHLGRDRCTRLCGSQTMAR